MQSFKIKYPKCHQPRTLTDVRFSTKGEIHFDLVCVVCGIPLTFDSTWEEVIISCHKTENPLLLEHKVFMEVPATMQ